MRLRRCGPMTWRRWRRARRRCLKLRADADQCCMELSERRRPGSIGCWAIYCRRPRATLRSCGGFAALRAIGCVDGCARAGWSNDGYADGTVEPVAERAGGEPDGDRHYVEQRGERKYSGLHE